MQSKCSSAELWPFPSDTCTEGPLSKICLVWKLTCQFQPLPNFHNFHCENHDATLHLSLWAGGDRMTRLSKVCQARCEDNGDRVPVCLWSCNKWVLICHFLAANSCLYWFLHLSCFPVWTQANEGAPVSTFCSRPYCGCIKLDTGDPFFEERGTSVPQRFF